MAQLGKKINMREFLSNLGTAYTTARLTDSQYGVELFCDALRTAGIGLEGKVTAARIADVLTARVQESGGLEQLPPWLKIVVRYCGEALGEDLLVEKGVNPGAVDPVIGQMQAKRRSLGMRKIYGELNQREYYNRFHKL